MRLHFPLLPILFWDVQTGFNWSYLSSQSKEFRGGFYRFIHKSTIAPLEQDLLFLFFFFLFRLTRLFKSSQAGFSSIVTHFDIASELNTGLWWSSAWSAIVIHWGRDWTSCWLNGHGSYTCWSKTHSHAHTTWNSPRKPKQINKPPHNLSGSWRNDVYNITTLQRRPVV